MIRRLNRMIGGSLIKIVALAGLFSVVEGVCNVRKDSLTRTDWTGIISSPGFSSGSYPTRQNCSWTIRVSKGSRIKLTITRFELEEGVKTGGSVSPCYDKLQVIDNGDMVLNACGEVLPSNQILSTSNEIRINFISDEAGSKAGFRLEYTGECKMDITDNAIVQTPNFPSSPPDSSECSWNIKVPNETLVLIHLDSQPNNLPSCNISPLLVTEASSQKKTKLCLIESKMLVFDDSKLTYDVTADSVPWNGSLKIEYLTKPNCDYFCVNSTCVLPRAMNIEQYKCVCPEGFTGRNCDVRLEIVDPCYPKSCKNNGTCLQFRGTFTCSCPSGLTGELCETVIDICSTDICKNGGKCKPDIVETYVCECPEGFSGKQCEIELQTDPCDKQPCKNGGTCSSSGSKFICDCILGFTGQTCAIEIDVCLSNPCPVNATCVTAVAAYSCVCPKGYKGENCNVKVDNCQTNPCKNGGTCINSEGDFMCVCDAGFTGKLCQVNINDCEPSPCVNGKCIDGRDSFTCLCDKDFVGRICSIHKDEAHCLEEHDTLPSSSILWLDTRADDIDIQSCPNNVLGNASRSCVFDRESETGGAWTRPDLSECVSKEFARLALEAELINKLTQFEVKPISDITAALTELTSFVRDPKNVQLYPGDLRMATTVVAAITEGLYDTDEVDGSTAWHIAQDLTNSMDNIIDPATKEIWENARVKVVIDQMKSLLESSEKLAEYFSLHVFNTRSTRAVNSASEHGETNNLRFVGRNLEFQISTVPDKQNDGKIGIVLPNAVFKLANEYNKEQPVSFYFGKFASMSDFLSMKESRYGHNESNTQVNSDIISSKVLGFPESIFSYIPEPVVITYKIKNTESDSKHMINHCVFMNMSATSSEEQWSDKGCFLHKSNSTHVVCHCFHLTNFALLLDVYQTSEKLDESNNAVLSYISYIGGSLSILGCLASIIVFEYFRLKSDRIRIHEQLAASIIMVQVIFLIGIGRTSDKDSAPLWACKTVAILLHYTLTALFCWMLVEGIHLYVVLVRVFKRGSHLKKYMALGWGAPLVIVGISVGVFYPSYGEGRICWLAQNLLLTCFVPTVGLVVIINTVVLIITIRVMMKSMKSTAKANVQEKSSFKISLKAAAILLPLLGLTWTLAFLAINTEGTEILAYVFTYLFTIGNAFQGLIFFVFHCLLNVDVHSAFARRYHRKKSTETTSSRARKCSELDSYTIDGKGTITPKFEGISGKANNVSIDQPKFNPNLHFKDYEVSEADAKWNQYLMAHQQNVEDQFVLRLRSDDMDPAVSEYINDIEDYLEKPSRNSAIFSSTS